MKAVVFAGWKTDGNVISMCRTADGLGFDEVLVKGRKRITKKFIGSKMLSLREPYKTKVRFFDTDEEIVKYLRNRGYNSVIMELSEQSEDIMGFEYPENPAIIVGHETLGVPQCYLGDYIMLPMTGNVRCMNVSVAASIAMYDYCLKNGTN